MESAPPHTSESRTRGRRTPKNMRLSGRRPAKARRRLRWEGPKSGHSSRHSTTAAAPRTRTPARRRGVTTWASTGCITQVRGVCAANVVSNEIVPGRRVSDTGSLTVAALNSLRIRARKRSLRYGNFCNLGLGIISNKRAAVGALHPLGADVEDRADAVRGKRVAGAGIGDDTAFFQYDDAIGIGGGQVEGE